MQFVIIYLFPLVCHMTSFLELCFNLHFTTPKHPGRTLLAENFLLMCLTTTFLYFFFASPQYGTRRGLIDVLHNSLLLIIFFFALNDPNYQQAERFSRIQCTFLCPTTHSIKRFSYPRLFLLSKFQMKWSL